MPIEPRRLVVLDAVARYGSVAAAADALHLTPSAVSQQLAALQRECGVAIVDRSRRGGQRPIQLTPAGRRLLGYAAGVVQLLDDAAGEMRAMSGALADTVVISVFYTALRTFVAEAVVELADKYPDLRPRLREVDELEAAAEVLGGRSDLAVVEDDSQRPRAVPRGLQYEMLGDDPYRLAVPADWPVADVAGVAGLADRPWIDGPPDTALWHAMRRLRRSTGLPLRAAHVCREFTTGLTLVAGGLAGLLVPELAVAAAAPGPEVRVAAAVGVGARRIGLLYRSGRHQPSPAVRAAASVLRSAVSRQLGDPLS